jgi:preprotein translocase subunit SecD
MNDLVQQSNNKFYDKISFAAPPAVLSGGKLYTAVSIDAWSIPVNTKIDKGSSQITGDFTIQEAKDLANVLNSGKVPAPAKIIQDTVVGPSLGQESINAGIISFVIASSPPSCRTDPCRAARG